MVHCREGHPYYIIGGDNIIAKKVVHVILRMVISFAERVTHTISQKRSYLAERAVNKIHHVNSSYMASKLEEANIYEVYYKSHQL